ncbi:amidohydrolase [Clostridia bacterium]|nr:amidohydrolase [Clostridia bacterium]
MGKIGKKIYYNGTILTAVDDRRTAVGILTEDGIIKDVAYDCADALISSNPEAEIVDLKRGTLVPGFIDGHSHFLQNTLELLQLDARPSPLGKADSLDELITSLKEQLKNPKFADMEYIYARGYDEAVYPDHKIPTRFDLDKVTSKPLALTHASGHNTVFNSAALERAGIGDGYIPPKGGSVGRFADGTLTGIFHEIARADALPKAIQNEREILDNGIESVVLQYVSHGVTTAQDGGTSKQWYAYTQDLAARGKLPLDVLSYIIDKEPEEVLTAAEPWDNRYVNHYRAAGFKIFLDGSPQAKTAWLSKPYHIPPDGADADYTGYGIYADDVLTEIFKKAVAHHWQVNVHTNGDEAIEQFIRTYHDAVAATGVTTDLRPVSIHCQTVREDQLDRMKEYGIIPSFFVDHTFYWGDYHTETVLGEERARRISPLTSAIKRNISFSLHQDTPVARQDPIFAIHSAVNRTTRSGRVLGEEFRISPWEALKAVTINAAYQIFEEASKGSVEVGKRADFAILSDNPLTVPPEKIKEIVVLETIKDSETIYTAQVK